MTMKALYSRLASLILLTACVFALSACKDETPTPSETGTGSPTRMELGRVNSFYELNAPSGSGWTVTGYPDWAVPMSETGTEGEKILLFVETNDEDEDRTGTLTVVGSEGNTLQFTLSQHGMISDEDNGEELSAKDLKLTKGVGYTVNVFGVSSNSKYNVLASSPINAGKLANQLKQYGEPDAMTDEDRYYSRVESVTGNSTSAVANQLSINAGIEVGISAFKISVAGGYAQNESGNDRYTYAIEEIQHITGSRQLRPGMLRMLAEKGADIFQSTFKKDCETLKSDPANETVMHRILTRYGTHVITQGTLGGELKLSMQMKVTDQTSSSDIHAALGLGVSVLNVDGEFNMNNKEQAIANNTTISLVTYGGNNVYTIAPGTTFNEFQTTVKDKKKLDEWVSTIQSGENVALIDMETIPIYDLMPTEAARNAMREYMMGKYQSEVYANDTTYKGPDLYVLQNFHREVELPLESEIYIPEIDMQVVAQRGLIPGLSSTEYSTVIYSGNQGDVDRNRGFFVGSPTRRPCKFHKDNAGNVVIDEEFDKLSPGAITELYVDATGDITIFPASNADFYRTVTFAHWTSDISKTTTRFATLNSSDFILTGSNPNLEIRLADGVTTTLAGVKMCRIYCDGNAGIILEDGTENEIYSTGIGTSMKYPEGDYSVTISGNGSLSAISYVTGIGPYGAIATGGNIRIKGGKIYAKGNTGAGIGASSWGASLSRPDNCGDITITGGEITAETSSFHTAAIGGRPH